MHVTKPQPNADEYAELLASMSIAIGLAVTKQPHGASLKEVLAQASRNMAGRYWQITAARKLRISPWMWIDRPWHCWQIRKLANELLDPAEDGPDVQAKVAKLGRYSAMVEFGVNVNESWYRRLRGAVADGVTTHTELRALLRKPTVWWGTKRNVTSNFLGCARELWCIGRPPDGELLVKQFHPITRGVLMVIFFASTLAAGIGVGMVYRLVSSHLGSHESLATVIDFTVAMSLLSLASWWIGPSSTNAVRRLEQIFNSHHMKTSVQ
jgi:hypothetical protein